MVLGQSYAFGQLSHRYSFTSDASDSIGSADGTVIDPGTPTHSFTNGMLDFSANTGQFSNNITEDAYLDLPNGIISGAASAGVDGAIALEWWFTVTTTRTWQRLGDFGNSNNGEDTSDGGGAADYLAISANSGRHSDGLEITNHPASGFEPNIGLPGTAHVGTPTHLMAVYNHNDPRAFTPQGANGTMSMYVNGDLVGHAPIHPDIDLRTFPDVNNWLGRSQWPDPLFTGMYDEFRIYNTAPSPQYVANSFAAGPDTLAAFDPWVAEFDLSLVVDRDTGTFTLNNAGPAIDVVGISIASASGALDPDNWQSVSGNYDAAGDGSFDPNDNWVINSNTPFLLDEFEQTGDGGRLGTGGTQTSLQLGAANAWTLSRFEDLVVSVDRLLPDFSEETIGVRVEYINGLGQAAARSDLNFDGVIDADDWILFAANHFGNFEGMTPAQAAVLGDLNGDLSNEFEDFVLFKADFDAANGAGAFAALISGVPEPTTAVLMLIAGCTALGMRPRVLLSVK